MSDVIKPDEAQSQAQPIPEAPGQVGETLGTEELRQHFDLPSVIPPPEHRDPYDKQTDKDEPKKGLPTWLKVTGGVLLGAGLSAGAMTVVGGSGDKKALVAEGDGGEPLGGPSETTITVPGPTTTEASSTPSSAIEVESSSSFGNVDVAGSIEPGEPTFTVTRANGERVTLPKLRSTDDLNEFGESAAALMACIFSPGIQGEELQKCLDELSTNTAVQELVLRIRQDAFVTPYVGRGFQTENDFHVFIYDKKDSPAIFERGEDPDSIILKGGPVFLQFSDSIKWQTTDTSTGDWPTLVFSQLEFHVAEREAGQPPEITELSIYTALTS